MKNRWHHLDTLDVVQLLDTNVKHGLTNEQVGKRQLEFGKNRLTQHPGTPSWIKFASQFRQPLAYILLIASCITFILGETVDAAVIFAVIFINAVAGFIQEQKAEKAIKELSHFVKTATTVIRNGKKSVIDSEELVPGESHTHQQRR